MHFEEGTTSFDWRLVVYQQNGATTCNKAFGNWTAVECNQINRHCGVLLHQDTFPIITGVGTDGNCGPASADRRFKTYAQLRKSADTGYSDMLAHGGTYANLTVYSR
jgi:hypothetical protein